MIKIAVTAADWGEDFFAVLQRVDKNFKNGSVRVRGKYQSKTVFTNVYKIINRNLPNMDIYDFRNMEVEGKTDDDKRKNVTAFTKELVSTCQKTAKKVGKQYVTKGKLAELKQAVVLIPPANGNGFRILVTTD